MYELVYSNPGGVPGEGQSLVYSLSRTLLVRAGGTLLRAGYGGLILRAAVRFLPDHSSGAAGAARADHSPQQMRPQGARPAALSWAALTERCGGGGLAAAAQSQSCGVDGPAVAAAVAAAAAAGAAAGGVAGGAAAAVVAAAGAAAGGGAAGGGVAVAGAAAVVAAGSAGCCFG